MCPCIFIVETTWINAVKTYEHMDESACNMWKCKCYVRFCIKDKLFTLDLYNFDIKVQSTNNQYFLAHFESHIQYSNNLKPTLSSVINCEASPAVPFPFTGPRPSIHSPSMASRFKIDFQWNWVLTSDALRIVWTCDVGSM